MAANNNRPAKARKRGAASRFFLGILRILGTILLIMLTTGLIFSCIFAAYVKNHLSSAMDIKPEDFSLNLTSVIYYTDKETGEYKELSLLYGKENREWVDYEEIPKWLEKAAVAIEDKRFYKHSGVDWYRT
ncbi:MAG TPA: transglycosylase, partial [Clostridiales bacterium]|nr:transglycosylase [Clostridiales bacterium]